MHPTRSRLEETRPVFDAAEDLATDLERAGMDLWAAGLRSCLDGRDQRERLVHLRLELTRLQDTSTVRRLGLRPAVELLLGHLLAGGGLAQDPLEPVYRTLRDLADHLELHGGRRWLARLRHVATDPDRPAPERLARLDALLARMTPGTESLPEGTAVRVRAARERLARAASVEGAAQHAALALRAPAPRR